MNLLWLNIDDEAGPASERGYLERNAIGLLSRIGLLNPSTRSTWLGRLSPDWRIAASGLWNLNHVFMKTDDNFLDRLEVAIDNTIGRASTASLPPVSQPSIKTQLELFRGKRQA
jgi:hypothetical protein